MYNYMCYKRSLVRFWSVSAAKWKDIYIYIDVYTQTYIHYPSGKRNKVK